MEFVRSHPEVPKLQDWNPSTGPIDLNDWLALIEPIMADLTATSGEWWEKLLKECRQWYQDHMALSPLDRLAHEPKPSKELEQPRWTRLGAIGIHAADDEHSRSPEGGVGLHKEDHSHEDPLSPLHDLSAWRTG